jgi:hypothetical protein
LFLVVVLGALATYVYVNHYKLSRPTYYFFIKHLPFFMRNKNLDYIDWRQQPAS